MEIQLKESKGGYINISRLQNKQNIQRQRGTSYKGKKESFHDIDIAILL